jgi:glycosyltransferase involved in cell wall biosynthesis
VTSKNADDCKLVADDSLEQRSNGFVFDPKSSDALSEALRRIADQKTNSRVFETARGRAEGKPIDQETNGLTEMGRRSREIVANFSCENFARQALSAARAAQQA